MSPRLYFAYYVTFCSLLFLFEEETGAVQSLELALVLFQGAVLALLRRKLLQDTIQAISDLLP